MGGTIVIKINDARLVVAGDGQDLHVEPGFAVVDKGEILTGVDAFARSRIMPRHTSSSHWAGLSAERGSADVTGVDTAAELALAQLARLWAEHKDRADDAILVVPDDYPSQALGVLLGLAQECGMPVRAMVESAVAASDRPFPNRQLLYVDAGLHGVTVTDVEQGEEATTAASQRLDTGLAKLMDAFARRIAELFVLETRFDPLHQAETEQRIYDGLADWLAALRDNERIPVEIEHGGQSFAIELERRNLLGAAQGFYRALRQLVAQMRHGNTGLAIQLSDKIAAIPGVVDALGGLDDAVIVTHERGQSATSLLGLADRIGATEGSQVRLYRHLPWRREPDPDVIPATGRPAAASPVTAAGPAPTHLVYCGVAYRINGSGMTIGRGGAGDGPAIVVDDASQGVSRTHCSVTVADGELRLRDLSRYGTFVNEKRIDGEAVLKPADVIRIGTPGAELTAIRLADSEGGTG